MLISRCFVFLSPFSLIIKCKSNLESSQKLGAFDVSSASSNHALSLLSEVFFSRKPSELNIAPAHIPDDFKTASNCGQFWPYDSYLRRDRTFNIPDYHADDLNASLKLDKWPSKKTGDNKK